MKPLCQNFCTAISSFCDFIGLFWEVFCDFIGLFWEVFLRPLFVLGINDLVDLKVILKMLISASNLSLQAVIYMSPFF